MFTPKEQQVFLEDIASLVDDGVPARRAVEVIANIVTGRMAEVARSVLMRIAEGKFLADGLRGWFPDAIVEVVRAGEEGGTLARTLHIAAQAVTRKNTAINALLNALTYPLVVVCLGLGVAVFINHSVLAQFSTIKPIAQWPEIGQNAVAFAYFVQYWWWAVLVGLVALLLGIVWVLRVYVGDGRKWLDAIPVLSLYRQFTAGRVMEVLGLLISNGVIIKKALKIMQYNAAPYLSMHLMTMEYRLSGGKENIAEMLDTGLIGKQDLTRLKVIATGRGFEHALVRQGMRATEFGMQRVQTVARVMGGILLSLGAMLAAFMILSVYAVGSVLAT